MEQSNQKDFILNYFLYSPLIIKEYPPPCQATGKKMKQICVSQPFWILGID